ncbi:MAG TPA: glycosyl hydrolase [Verrucomicrobiae bacterium]|jgi:mannan endo-1,4-beta-mannosidase|nr:glycosyl hydrolase [Verrucomicrobiae bacterium]
MNLRRCGWWASVLVVGTILVAGLSAFGQNAANPANPHANAKARALLKYFQELSATTNRHILSGQFTQFGAGANLRIIDQINASTGHRPAIVGVDYADLPTDITTNHPNRTVIDYWRQGGIVTVSAHMYDPANTNDYGLRDKGVDLATLLSPGKTHDEWMHELDLIAAGLRQLKDSGVVVLWRPFHEMNGAWFWWGGKEPELFIKVWRQMFDYFTDVKGLDNLLWVYAPNHGRKTAAYYPGDRYADLVGLDAYTDFIDTNHIQGFAAVAALPKPFGFTEFGPHGASNPPGDYDFLRFIEGIEKNFPQTCFFMCWNDKWSLARNEHTKELLSRPAIINREDLPSGLTGK